MAAHMLCTATPPTTTTITAATATATTTTATATTTRARPRPRSVGVVEARRAAGGDGGVLCGGVQLHHAAVQ